jgi:hypothetical protein
VDGSTRTQAEAEEATVAVEEAEIALVVETVSNG